MPKFELDQFQPVTSGLIADAITAYLERPDKAMHKEVLDEMAAAFRRMVLKQLMAPRQDRKGYESTTSYTHSCPRKARLTYDGAEREALKARTLLKFLLGDMVELTVLGIAKLAGLDIGMNNEDLTIEGRDCKLIPVHPDGLLHHESRWYNVEVKSCDSKTFDKWLEQGGPDDAWGYRTQASLEIQAWRETTLEVNETCFVAVSTGTRQGSVAEWRLPFQLELVEAWHDRREQARNIQVPAIPYAAQPEIQYVKGKEVAAELLASPHGEPQPRQDKNGRIHGWDVPTGRQIVPTVPCGYCDFVKTQCWTSAELDFDGGKPIWVVPAKKTAIASDEEFREYMDPPAEELTLQ